VKPTRDAKTLSRQQEAYTRWKYNIVYQKGLICQQKHSGCNKVSGEDLAEKQNNDTFCQTLMNILKVETIQQINKKMHFKPANNLHSIVLLKMIWYCPELLAMEKEEQSQ
jgi:hypothetical protein